MKISDLKPGQKVSIDGLNLEYVGIKKVKIINNDRVKRRVFKGSRINICKYYDLSEGSLTLQDENIILLDPVEKNTFWYKILKKFN